METASLARLCLVFEFQPFHFPETVMSLQPVNVVTKPAKSVSNKPIAGEVVKKTIKSGVNAKKATPVKAEKEKEDVAAAKAQEKEAAIEARILENETTRRANAIARIQAAALAAGEQKARIETFICRLRVRIERSCVRVAKLVEAERARQAKALETYPVLQKLAPNEKELEAAAAVPKVDIPVHQLPAYIANMADEVE
jgi:hypothetical protein